MLHSIEYSTGIPRLSTFASEIRIDFLIHIYKCIKLSEYESNV